MTSQTVPILKAYASKTAPYCRTHPNVGSLGASGDVRWKMEDGRCKMEDVRWKMDDGAFTNGFIWCIEGWKRLLLLFGTVALPFPSLYSTVWFAFLCKVSQSLRLTKHRRAIYEDFCRQPSHLSMILVENGYSIKNHGKLSGMPFPRDWLFRHRKAKTRRRRYAEK